MKSNLEGPAYKLLKGNYKNYIELEHNMEQCYLALKDYIDWVNLEGDRCTYDPSKPLPLQGPPEQTPRLNGDEIVDLITALRLFIRRIDIKKRVEDVQLGVKSYQIKLNITRPQVRCDGLDAKEAYTILYEPRCVVYLNKNNGKYLMRANKVYKFSNGTQKPVRDILHSRLQNFVLGYNNAGMPDKAWTRKDQKRTASILKNID
ncbi:hypothetical protein Tco_1235578 [Tanacetum coccineum]